MPERVKDIAAEGLIGLWPLTASSKFVNTCVACARMDVLVLSSSWSNARACPVLAARFRHGRVPRAGPHCKLGSFRQTGRRPHRIGNRPWGAAGRSSPCNFPICRDIFAMCREGRRCSQAKVFAPHAAWKFVIFDRMAAESAAAAVREIVKAFEELASECPERSRPRDRRRIATLALWNPPSPC
jgi:hypothetical protein